MKIIDIKTTVVNAQMRNWVFVKVITDQDLYGWGEATVEWKTRAVAGAIEDLKPLLVGKDPRNIKQNFQIMTKHGFWKMGVIGMTAISGIEHALWDILGKSLNTKEIKLQTNNRILNAKIIKNFYVELEMGKPLFSYEEIPLSKSIFIVHITNAPTFIDNISGDRIEFNKYLVS